MIAGRRAYVLLGVLALAWGTLLALLLEQPGYTDAYYYFNAAKRLAEGHGLSDPYLWTYFNAPDRLPGPSHTYWMPLESVIARIEYCWLLWSALCNLLDDDVHFPCRAWKSEAKLSSEVR